MKPLLAWLLLTTSALGAMIQPVGYFVMQPLHGNNPELKDAVIGSPKLVGFHVRDKWSLLEPTKGRYDFAWIDRQLARAAAAHKQVTLGIYSGTSNDPAWNDVASFTGLVRAFGARYAGNPAVAAVHLSAPQVTADSMEMYLPASFTKGNAAAIAIWEQSIDAFHAAFPATPLVLDLAMAPDSQGAITKAVDEYARQVLGDRLNVIICTLKASTSTSAPHFRELLRLRGEGVRIGFEMVGPSSDQSRFGGSFAKALSIGSAAGGQWYQIYQSDIGNIPAALHGAVAPEPGAVALLASAVAGSFLWSRVKGRRSSLNHEPSTLNPH